jgi:diguanylate cyclase (GGDEF)-like protein/PAS domain S-box-containing protein
VTATAPSRRLTSRLAEPFVLLPIIAIVLLGVIWGTTLNLVRVESDIESRTAAASSVELAETYEAQVVRALREIEQSLRFLQFAYDRSGRRIDLKALRTQGLLLPDMLFVTSLVDADGAVFATTRPAQWPRVVPQEAFLGAGGRLSAVGRPWRDADGEWKLDFTRALRNPAGELVGGIVISVPAAYFVSGYEPAKLGNRGVLAIVGADGIFRARRIGDDVTSGEWAGDRAASHSEGPPPVFESAWDGVRRFTSVRPLYDFPLSVVVGLAESEQLAAANARAQTYLWRAVGGSALLILILALLARMTAKASEYKRRAQEELNLRNRAIESSVNAIVITSLDKPGMPISYVNPAFETITGYTAAEAMGRNGAFLLGDELDQPGMQELELALSERREAHAVLRNYRKDGSIFWNDFHMAPVRNDEGHVTHYVGVMNDVTDAKNYESQLAHQANYDGLTGLANRNLLRDRLRQSIASVKRNGGSVAAVFLDLDHFKRVNDSLGHSEGDVLLRTVGERLRACVRETDTVARLGGDEFVLLLVGRRGEAATLETDVTVLLHKLLAEISRPVLLAGKETRPACSMGVAIHPQDGEDAETLLRNADAAMYRAKELGRNRFQFFTADVHERVRRRMELESSLRLALERNEFELHYQPQVSLKRGGIVGAEALIRWRHPDMGLIYPAQFIPFAEESGLIVPIGEWVLRHACAQNKAWQEAGLPPIAMAVNMSARQCEQHDVDAVVRRALTDSRLEPRYLELEITESLSMANPDQSVPLMQRLKDTGVTLSIDDFGTGFSNLSYLKRFPVDRLKIDLSFIREITSDPGSLAISEAIITMSHRLNLQVMAEGVETEGQLALLGARNCDGIQGYFFSPPVAADEFARLLQEGRCLSEAHVHRGTGIHHAHATLQ